MNWIALAITLIFGFLTVVSLFDMIQYDREIDRGNKGAPKLPDYSAIEFWALKATIATFLGIVTLLSFIVIFI